MLIYTVIALRACRCWLGVRTSIRPVKELSDEVLAWLSVLREVQMICIRAIWCQCHSVISCFIKIQIGFTFLVLAYPGCPGKEAVKMVSLCLNLLYDYLTSKWDVYSGMLLICWGGEADSADWLGRLASRLCVGQQLAQQLGGMYQANRLTVSAVLLLVCLGVGLVEVFVPELLTVKNI